MKGIISLTFAAFLFPREARALPDPTGVFEPPLGSGPTLGSGPVDPRTGLPPGMTPEQAAALAERERRRQEQEAAAAAAARAAQAGSPPSPLSASGGPGGSDSGCGGGGSGGGGPDADKKKKEREDYYKNLNKSGQSAVPLPAIGGPGMWISSVLLALAPRRKGRRSKRRLA